MSDFTPLMDIPQTAHFYAYLQSSNLSTINSLKWAIFQLSHIERLPRKRDNYVNFAICFLTLRKFIFLIEKMRFLLPLNVRLTQKNVLSVLNKRFFLRA